MCAFAVYLKSNDFQYVTSSRISCIIFSGIFVSSAINVLFPFPRSVGSNNSSKSCDLCVFFLLFLFCLFVFFLFAVYVYPEIIWVYVCSVLFNFRVLVQVGLVFCIVVEYFVLVFYLFNSGCW